jgi:hypothetical protein
VGEHIAEFYEACGDASAQLGGVIFFSPPTGAGALCFVTTNQVDSLPAASRCSRVKLANIFVTL